MATMKRKPSQEDLAYDDVTAAEEAVPTDDAVDNSAMDLVGESDRKQEPTDPTASDSRTNQTIARMVAGATPTLFGMLFGPQQAERGIAQTQKFFAGGKPSKLVPIVGPDGTPIYETPEAAIGERVYQKPSIQAGTARPYGKWLQGKTWIKKEDGTEELVDTLTNNASNEVINAYTKEPITASRSYVKPTVFARKDIGGGTTVLETDITKQGPRTSATPVLKGPGQYYNVGTEGQARIIEKGIESGQKTYQDLYEKEQAITGTIKSLKTNTDPRVLSQDIYALARSAEGKDRLTEQDFKQLTGTDKETWLKRVGYAIDTGAFGEIRDLSRSFIPLANRILEKTKKQKESISLRFAPQTKEAQESIRKILPGTSSMPSVPSHIKQMTREEKIKKYRELKAQGKL